MSSNLKHEQNGQASGQTAPAWAVTLIAEMRARKLAAKAPVLSTGLRAAAGRQQVRQQTKGHGSAYGAAKFTASW